MKMNKSIFLIKEGNTPKNRILDFLIVHREFDYSLRDIARFSSIGYTTMKAIKKELIKDGWIVFTRKVGKAKMYKLNIEKTMVKRFIDFYWSVIESEVEPSKAPKTHTTSSRIAVPVSAKHV